MKTNSPFVTLFILIGLLAAQSSRAAEPTFFRKHGGVAADSKQRLPERFGEQQTVWRQPLAPGQSTPCLYGDSIFLTTYVAAEKALATVALDRSTGKVRWRAAAPAKEIEEFHRVGSPAVSTPACDGERLYVFFGSYGLLCYSLDGNLLWSKPMGPFQDEFGAGSSPVLVDDKIILNEDHDVDSFLIAIDKMTGKTVWKTPREGFTRSYSTPVIWQEGERKLVVVAGALQLAAYDVQDGGKVWWVDGLSRILDTTPIVVDRTIYLATWTPGGDQAGRISMQPFEEAAKQFDKDKDGMIAKTELPEGDVLTRFFRIDLNQDEKLNADEWAQHARVFDQAQNAAMAVKPKGKGNLTKSCVQWIARRGLPTVPSPVVYQGVVYMVKNGGIITSLDAATGEILKQGRAAGRGNYYPSLVAGDGKVYVLSENGVLTILKAGKTWETLGTHDLGERCMSTPILADGVIYLRTDEALYCFRAE